jgi:ArsR family transcriptional regulator
MPARAIPAQYDSFPEKENPASLHIDNHLCVLYAAGMATNTIRLRPTDQCCEPLVEPPVQTAGEQAQLLAMFKALADGTRLQIFRLIAVQREPICACEIVDRFDVSQPTIAHHTKILREAGLITVSRRGIWAYYEVDRTGIGELQDAVTALAPPILTR